MRKLIPTLIVSTAFFLTSCGDDCSSALIKSAKSTDKVNAISLFKKNCGATTGYVYEIRLNNTKSPAELGDLVLRFDNNHAIDWPDDDNEIAELSWINNSVVNVVIPKSGRIFNKKDSSNNIIIRYSYK